MRQQLSFPVPNWEALQALLLQTAKPQQAFALLCSNTGYNQPDPYGRYDLLCAIDSLETLSLNQLAFASFEAAYQKHPDWWFGYLGYDLKNELEKLQSNHTPNGDFADLLFFRPKYVISVKNKSGYLHYPNEISTAQAQAWLNALLHPSVKSAVEHNPQQPLDWKCNFTKEEYIQQASELKKHLQRGDIYEVNFCMRYKAHCPTIAGSAWFERLNAISRAPFAAYMQHAHTTLVCSSPERYLQKQDAVLISQPIKGTRKRGLDKIEDDTLKKELENDPKERSENVMIVDLVRNDLSRVAKRASVHVNELCGVYTFQQVHQLISTVQATLREELTWMDAIRSTFPMGSMTGAPKIEAMKLIEQYERSKRGVYSGALGYIDPLQNMDFNVIIRTLLHDASSQQLSFMVGSAFTINAQADAEYEECLVKAKALLEIAKG